MAKRSKMQRGRSRRVFTKHARAVHRKNMLGSVGPMRGGIRL